MFILHSIFTNTHKFARSYPLQSHINSQVPDELVDNDRWNNWIRTLNQVRYLKTYQDPGAPFDPDFPYKVYIKFGLKLETLTGGPLLPFGPGGPKNL